MRKRTAGATLSATDFPVWATGNPVTLTVVAVAHSLRRVNAGRFGGDFIEISETLTSWRATFLFYTIAVR